MTGDWPRADLEQALLAGGAHAAGVHAAVWLLIADGFWLARDDFRAACRWLGKRPGQPVAVRWQQAARLADCCEASPREAAVLRAAVLLAGRGPVDGAADEQAWGLRQILADLGPTGAPLLTAAILAHADRQAAVTSGVDAALAALAVPTAATDRTAAQQGLLRELAASLMAAGPDTQARRAS